MKLYTPKAPGWRPLADFANETKELTNEKKKKEGIISPKLFICAR